MNMHRTTNRIAAAMAALALAGIPAFAVAPKKPAQKKPAKAVSAKAGKPAPKTVVRRTALVAAHLRSAPAARRKVYYSPWTEPTFADSTFGDRVDGEDLLVRRAAVSALGPYNGSVVVVDPQNGRILSLVNQNLAFKSGFQPCSTIKLVAAFAGLNEGIVDRSGLVKIGRRSSLDLTGALAHSNNAYFANIGQRLGFEKIVTYGRMYGLGEKACVNCEQEQPGSLPDAPSPEGLGMMTSFGSGTHLTPLQLASLLTAMANGGTLFHLQHPLSQEEAAMLTPKVKRRLEIAQWLPDVKPGMEGAVEYGTARRASYNQNEPIFGKTGTCTDERQPGVHLGWFGSFNETGNRRLVVVVLLTGGRAINGPVASGVAGAVYRGLSEQGYFGSGKMALVTRELGSGQISGQ